PSHVSVIATDRILRRAGRSSDSSAMISHSIPAFFEALASSSASSRSFPSPRIRGRRASARRLTTAKNGPDSSPDILPLYAQTGLPLVDLRSAAALLRADRPNLRSAAALLA